MIYFNMLRHISLSMYHSRYADMSGIGCDSIGLRWVTVRSARGRTVGRHTTLKRKPYCVGVAADPPARRLDHPPDKLSRGCSPCREIHCAAGQPTTSFRRHGSRSPLCPLVSMEVEVGALVGYRDHGFTEQLLRWGVTVRSARGRTVGRHTTLKRKPYCVGVAADPPARRLDHPPDKLSRGCSPCREIHCAAGQPTTSFRRHGSRSPLCPLVSMEVEVGALVGYRDHGFTEQLPMDDFKLSTGGFGCPQRGSANVGRQHPHHHAGHLEFVKRL